jgi:hypothetical protein
MNNGVGLLVFSVRQGMVIDSGPIMALIF